MHFIVNTYFIKRCQMSKWFWHFDSATMSAAVFGPNFVQQSQTFLTEMASMLTSKIKNISNGEKYCTIVYLHILNHNFFEVTKSLNEIFQNGVSADHTLLLGRVQFQNENYDFYSTFKKLFFIYYLWSALKNNKVSNCTVFL